MPNLIDINDILSKNLVEFSTFEDSTYYYIQMRERIYNGHVNCFEWSFSDKSIRDYHYNKIADNIPEELKIYTPHKPLRPENITVRVGNDGTPYNSDNRRTVCRCGCLN
jgi:hypothetical protein